MKITDKGFTLVEIMVVIAIIAVISSILVPNVSGLVSKAKKSSAQATVQTTYTALTAYYDAVGYYPSGTYWNTSYNLRDRLIDYASVPNYNTFLQDSWGQWMSYHSPGCYGYVGSIYSNGPNRSNETWSCWWWRYRGFAGDDIGLPIKVL